ncbi:MAG: PaaI family thioesterase [Chloroflexota bacterium]|nr:PaaI family thioesterase [Chloroflexota bacterium]
MQISISEEYNMCFGCGKDNPAGFHLRFHQEDGEAVAEFVPDERYQGWEGIMHGGLISTLLDEAIGYAAYYRGIIPIVTARMEVRFHRPIPIGQKVLIRAKIIQARRKLADAQATVKLADGPMAAEATALLYITADGSLPDPLEGG